MATWQSFAEANPTLAQAGAAQLFQYGIGLAYLATIRKDGGPRLHPVCPVLSKSRLYILVAADSPKRKDLERDGRYALQSWPQARPDSDEFYLSGTARVIPDPEACAAILADAKHYASAAEIFFELDIDRAMRTTWQGYGTPTLTCAHTTWVAPA